jgi:hypothetical protein
MKTLLTFVSVIGISLSLPSCFLFRGSKGAHCPAYGMELNEKKSTTLWATVMEDNPSREETAQ